MEAEYILALAVFFPFIAGIPAYRAGKGRNLWMMGGAALEFALMAGLALWTQGRTEPALELVLPKVCGLGLSFELDGFRMLYGCVAAFLWLAASAASKDYFSVKNSGGQESHSRLGRFYLFWFWTLGAVMGVFLSADLFTAFLFFEVMSFTSYVWVVQEENQKALDAGALYLAVAVAGGLVMLMGLFLLYHELGTLRMDELRDAAAACRDRKVLYAAGGCVLLGFGAKAGMFPLHIWLPKAHPAAPAPASALLSGILTKTGIYGILAVSCTLFLYDAVWGGMILALGTATMVLGAVLAVFSVDLKRTLACSSVSQIGFVLTGIGMQGLLGEENSTAVYGTVLHMVNHSMVKLILFLAAGVIYQNTHSLDLNRIRGFGRRKPLLGGVFLTGALCLAGIPGFGGYVSKTLLHESMGAWGGGKPMMAAEAAFLFSGGLTVAYMTKLFVAIFVEKNGDPGLQKQYDECSVVKERERKSGNLGKKAGGNSYMGVCSRIVLAGSALLLLVWGLLPHTLMDRAAELAKGFMNPGGDASGGEALACYSPENLEGMLISVSVGVLVYLFFVRKVLKKADGYRDAWPAWMDLERGLYRPVLLIALPWILGVLFRILDYFADGCVVILRKSFYRDSKLPCERTEGNVLTACLGGILNKVQNAGRRICHKDRGPKKDYVHLAAARYEEIRENSLMIQRSLSFGLLLFGLGLVLTLAYLILW